MDKRKLDSAVDESLAEQQLHKSDTINRNSGSLHLVELHGSMAGWLANRQIKINSKILMLALYQNARLSSMLSQDTALFPAAHFICFFQVKVFYKVLTL